MRRRVDRMNRMIGKRLTKLHAHRRSPWSISGRIQGSRSIGQGQSGEVRLAGTEASRNVQETHDTLLLTTNTRLANQRKPNVQPRPTLGPGRQVTQAARQRLSGSLPLISLETATRHEAAEELNADMIRQRLHFCLVVNFAYRLLDSLSV